MNVIISFLRENQRAIPIVIFIIPSIAGIYKFIKETSQKQNIMNFNYAKSLFYDEGLIELKNILLLFRIWCARQYHNLKNI